MARIETRRFQGKTMMLVIAETPDEVALLKVGCKGDPPIGKAQYIASDECYLRVTPMEDPELKGRKLKS